MTNCGAPCCTNRSSDNQNRSFHRLPAKSKASKRIKDPKQCGKKGMSVATDYCEVFYQCSLRKNHRRNI